MPSSAGFSSPEHVLERLQTFVDEYDLEPDDERWLMLDTDHWTKKDHINNFKKVCQAATQKGYHLAISNPCFEVWLLLHIEELDSSVQFRNCNEVIQRMKERLGGYSKRRIDPLRFTMDSLRIAVDRAENVDPSPDDRWPQSTGTHVFLRAKKLLP